MSADGDSQVPGSDPLQFDVAESAASPGSASPNTTCKACSKPITSTYYQVNGSVVCASCRAALDRPAGTRLHRALRATGLGVLAATAGSLLYFAVAAITGREFGLVAIAVGFMVGSAVRKGSGGRGGRAYQTLAVGLTYFAIVSTYIPLIAKEFQTKEFRKGMAKDSARVHSATPMVDTITISARGPVSSGEGADSSAPATRADNGFPVSQAGAPMAASPTGRVRPKHLGVGTVLLGIGALALLAAAIPILAGFSNIIGLLIIGIAVFEAWKLNRRLVLKITGPYRVAGGAEGARAIG